jgi:hypothetical protein
MASHTEIKCRNNNMAFQVRTVIATKRKCTMGYICVPLSSFYLVFYPLIYHHKCRIFLKAALLYRLRLYAFSKGSIVHPTSETRKVATLVLLLTRSYKKSRKSGHLRHAVNTNYSTGFHAYISLVRSVKGLNSLTQVKPLCIS